MINRTFLVQNIAILFIAFIPHAAAKATETSRDYSSSIHEFDVQRSNPECPTIAVNNRSLWWKEADGLRRELEDFVVKDMQMSRFLEERDGIQFLVEQNRGASKSATIVPVVCREGHLYVQRVIYTGIDLRWASSISEDVYYAQEEDLDSFYGLSNAAWEEIVGKPPSSMAALPLSEPRKLPDGTYTTPLVTRRYNPSSTTIRHYLGLKGSRTLVSDIACYSGCSNTAPVDTQRYVGFIGKHKIKATLHFNNTNVRGTYRYSTSESDLHLFGAWTDAGVSLRECEDAQCKSETGEIVGKADKSRLDGIWKSAKGDARVLPIVLVRDQFP